MTADETGRRFDVIRFRQRGYGLTSTIAVAQFGVRCSEFDVFF